MRIAFDAKRAFCNSRGLGHYSRTLVSNLIKYSSLKVDLYTPKRRVPFSQLESLDGEQFKIHEPTSFLGQLFPSLWRSFLLAQDVRPKECSLFHGLSNELPFGLHPHIKKVVTIHDLLFLKFPQYFSLIDRMIYKRKVKFALKSADIVLAISEQTRLDLLDFDSSISSKIQVIPQSTQELYSRFPDPTEIEETKKLFDLPEDFLLYVGAMEERKNVIGLLEAYALIAKEAPPLYLVGASGSFTKKILNRITELGLHKQVIYLKEVDSEKLRTLFYLSTLFVFPSFYEGHGLPLSEALMQKTPVLTSDLRCLRDTAGPGASYVNPQEIDHMASEMKALIENQEKRSLLAEEGHKYVQKFSPEKTTQKLIELYQELLET